MIDKQQKFHQPRKDDPPKLGNFVQWHIEQNNIRKKSVSDFLGILPTALNQYFKQQSIQVIILWRISRAINYNMVADLGQRLNIPFETDAEKELKAKLKEMEEEIKTLKTELKVYKEIHNI
jgi:hypothetical protein